MSRGRHSRGHRQQNRRLLTSVGAVVLVAGSIGFATAPSFAGQSDTGRDHSAHGQAQAAQAHAQKPHQTKKTSDRGSHTTGRTQSAGGGSATTGQGSSGVSLARPNDFQAQADPDGMENGGVDQPGGTGGVDTTTQDGNNGSGNDTDCEDDNNGVGIPGHCRPSPDTPDLEGDLEGDTVPDAGLGDVPASDGTLDQGQLQVAAPVLPDEPVITSSSSQVMVPGVFGTSAPPSHARTAAGVLPATGAGRALLGLTLAALVALAAGLGLARHSRRARTTT
jgi:type II secretory pathway pseudopilin PulG